MCEALIICWMFNQRRQSEISEGENGAQCNDGILLVGGKGGSYPTAEKYRGRLNN